MKIQCPHCAAVMRVKELRAGAFRPACRSCSQRFLLRVDESGAAKVSKLDATAADSSESQPQARTTVQPETAVETPPQKSAASPPLDETLPESPGGGGAVTGDATLPEQPARRGGDGTLPHVDAPTQSPAGEETMPQPDPVPAPNETLPARPARQAGGDETLEHGPPTASPDETIEHGPPTVSPDETMPHASTLPPTKQPKRAPGTPATRPAGDDGTIAQPDGVGDGLDIPERLGGYRLLRELGRGAMGAVYVARQIALSRDVALKVIQDQWAASPRMLARFMREAFAAAQISHHNVVQIYDLGADGAINFFSMELVPGCNLAELLGERGRLPPAEAAGLILQAARGLQSAHSQGLVHRDIKPANLLLSDNGVVKVADLGLVKIANVLEEPADDSGEADDGGLPTTARGDLTLAHNAMGTAAYMAPEQGEDAASVDHRADIYSLGCTFYAMLTGRPPFEGETAVELITKHQSGQIVRPDAIVDDLPADLTDIVLRMVAKDPADRQANIGEVIAELDRFLAQAPAAGSGAAESGSRQPSGEETAPLAALAGQYADAPAAKRRRAAGLSAVAGGLLLAAITALFHTPAAVGLAAAVAVGAVARQLVKHRGFGDGVFGKLRELLATARTSDIAVWGAAGLLLLAGLWVLDLMLVAIAALVVGIGAGAGFAFALDRAAEQQQRPTLDEAQDTLQQLRMKGYDEQLVRAATAAHAGREMLEDLFGYEAARKLCGRRRLSLRDAIYDAVDGRVERRRRQQQQDRLQDVEQQRLQSEGLSADEARDQAEQIAAALAEEVRELKREAEQLRVEKGDPAAVARRKKERLDKLLSEARDPRASSGLRRLTRFGMNQMLGGRTRFLAGAALLVACLLWIQQNELVDQLRTLSGLQTLLLNPAEGTEPLGLPVIGGWIDSLYVGLAGLALLFTAQYSGWRSSLTAFPGALLIAAGPALGVPSVGLPGGAWTVSAAAGLLVIAVGVYLFGDDEA